MDIVKICVYLPFLGVFILALYFFTQKINAVKNGVFYDFYEIILFHIVLLFCYVVRAYFYFVTV